MYGMAYNSNNQLNKMKMKSKIVFFSSLLILSLSSCDKEEASELEVPITHPTEAPATSNDLPDGYFEVSFLPSTLNPETRAAVTGSDSRVQHIRYIIYKATGEFVKEKEILLPSQGTPTWPFPAVKDTLLKGEYKAVFLGNVEKTLFPYHTHSPGTNYIDILTNYQSQYADARIQLPPTEFSNNTEYYWANVSFSDASPNPYILLQRIIGGFRLHRNFVDANNALNILVSNILSQIGYKNIIKAQLTGTLPNHSDGILYELIRPIVVNHLTLATAALLDPLVNQLVLSLADPIAEALYKKVGAALLTQIELALAANATGNEGGIAYLGRILNPWAYGHDAIVTIDDFPKTINFDLQVESYFPAGQRFKYGLKTDTGGTVNERYINIKGFDADYKVKKINILSEGLIAGLLIDEVVDEFLLPGMFIDITDPITLTNPKYNFRYKADYSFLDLRLKSYALQTDGAQGLTLEVQISQIANIDDAFSGALSILKLDLALITLINLLGGDFGLITGDIKALTVEVPVNVPLLGIDNLTLSGSWSTPAQY